ncbi:DUF2955 domain-containing protein [Agarivorans sp.]|uniref:DUF2955 domain-containing protein n=1 Tax=Agarivorans sp. TaxID=1872412 RepID=UPI003D05A3EC
MFRSPANPIIRLVFAPILLLFYQLYSGAPIPVLAPIFVVIFLTIMPSRPPLNLLLMLLVSLLVICFGIIALGKALLESPSGFALFCWSILFWSYYRSHRNPKDILSSLSLIVIIIMVVMTKQMGLPMGGFPWLMFSKFITAIVVTYVAFLLFPGEEKDILPAEQTDEAPEHHIGLIAFKATAMSLVLVALIGIGSSQTMLIAITIGNMMRSPLVTDHHIFGRNRLITTAVGILFTFPCMLLVVLGVSHWLLLGVSLFCGLQLACYGIRRRCRMDVYQLLFTNFTVLTYQVISHQGADSFSAQVLRLFSIAVAVFVAVLLLNLANHPKPNNTLSKNHSA